MYGVHSRKYCCKSSHRQGQEEAEQTADRFSEQSHVQRKGNLEKKIALRKLEEIVQQKDAMTNCDKKKLLQNIKTQNVMKLKKSNCDKTKKKSDCDKTPKLSSWPNSKFKL